MQFNKIPRDLDVFYADMLRLCSNRLSPKVSEIRAKDTLFSTSCTVTGQMVISFSRTIPLNSLSVGCLSSPEAFKLLLPWQYRAWCGLYLPACTQSCCYLWTYRGSAAIFHLLEFHNSFLGMYFEQSITIPAIVSQSVLGLG